MSRNVQQTLKSGISPQEERIANQFNKTVLNQLRQILNNLCFNVWRNATLEVCALNRTILGKTFEKNIQLLDKKSTHIPYMFYT